MAKEFKMKLQIDTSGAVQEIEGTIDTISGFEKQLGALQTKLNNTKIGTEEYKKLQKEYDRTAKAADNVKNANKGWLDTIASAPGLLGTFGQTIQGAGKAFGNFNMLLKTSLIGFIASAVIELVQQFKKMEGVMDPINKIASVFSGLMSKLASTILPLVIAPIELLAKGLEKLGNLFGGAGEALGDLADRQDALNDSTAEYELAQSKANEALAEAREKAADSTLSIKDRKKALEDAGNLERKIAAEGKARALEQARITAGELAVTMGMSKERIAAIKKYDAAQLESFAAEIKQRKDLNAEQRNQLLQQLGAISQIDAQTAKIGKKTQAGIEALDNEAAQKEKERRDKAIQAAKERQQRELDNAKQGIDAAIELEKNKADTSEKILLDLLEKKDKLNNKDILNEKAALEKKGANQTEADKKRLADINNVLEVQKQAREKAVKAEIKTDKDGLKQIADERDANEKKVIDNIKTNSDNVIATKQIELEKLKGLYGEDSEAYKKAQNEILKIQLETVQKQMAVFAMRALAGEKFTQQEIEQYNALALKAAQMANQVVANTKTEEVAQKQKLDAKAKAQKDADDFEIAQSGTTLERQLEILNARDADIQTRRDNELAKEKEKLDKKLIDQTTYETNVQNINTQAAKDTKANEDAKDQVREKAFQKEMARAQGYANALSALSELVGKDTVAGKAMGIASAVINTYVGASQVIAAKPTLPEPANTIMKIVNVATTIATGLKQVREIMAVKVPTEQVPEVRIRKALGGVLKGPTHAMGGIMTAFGELEGGEYVVNRTATQMFRPQLDAINGMGGNVEMQPQVLAGAVSSPEPPIFKTYVVASEMSSQQEIDRIIRSRSKM